MTKDLADIVKRLEEQKIAIDQAISALQQVDLEETDQAATKRGRPNKAAKKIVRKSTLSPEARERIAAAQRKRWKALKRTKKAATKAA